LLAPLPQLAAAGHQARARKITLGQSMEPLRTGAPLCAMGTALSPISSLIFGSYAAMVIVVYYGLCVRVDGGRSQAFVQRGPLRYYLSTPLYFHPLARLCSLMHCPCTAPGF